MSNFLVHEQGRDCGCEKSREQKRVSSETPTVFPVPLISQEPRERGGQARKEVGSPERLPVPTLLGLPLELRKAAYCLCCHDNGAVEIKGKKCPLNHNKYVLPAVLAEKEIRKKDKRIEELEDSLDFWKNEIRNEGCGGYEMNINSIIIWMVLLGAVLFDLTKGQLFGMTAGIITVMIIIYFIADEKDRKNIWSKLTFKTKG